METSLVELPDPAFERVLAHLNSVEALRAFADVSLTSKQAPIGRNAELEQKIKEKVNERKIQTFLDRKMAEYRAQRNLGDYVSSIAATPQDLEKAKAIGKEDYNTVVTLLTSKTSSRMLETIGCSLANAPKARALGGFVDLLDMVEAAVKIIKWIRTGAVNVETGLGYANAEVVGMLLRDPDTKAALVSFTSNAAVSAAEARLAQDM